MACSFPATEGGGTDALREATKLAPGRLWIDLNPWVCPKTEDGKCPVAVGGVLVYRQGSHVTNTYVETMTPIIEGHFAAAGLLGQ